MDSNTLITTDEKFLRIGTTSKSSHVPLTCCSVNISWLPSNDIIGLTGWSVHFVQKWMLAGDIPPSCSCMYGNHPHTRCLWLSPENTHAGFLQILKSKIPWFFHDFSMIPLTQFSIIQQTHIQNPKRVQLYFWLLMFLSCTAGNDYYCLDFLLEREKFDPQFP